MFSLLLYNKIKSGFSMLYQLMKTSVGLSGQVKWNIVIESGKVVDLYITPIHDSINYNHARKTKALNYTHLENIKLLYKEISSQFFEPIADPKLCSGYPIDNGGSWMDTREISYDMGLKRAKHKRYGKQFEFLSPIWADTKDFLDCTYFLVLENSRGEQLARKQIDMTPIQSYLKQYVDEIDLDTKLMYLDITKKESRIHGINAKEGRVYNQDTSYVASNILSMERPLLEFDSMLLNQFANNNMIAKQLFNFNFLFNVEDIIPKTLIHDLVGNKVNMYVDIYDKNGDKIEVRDLYSNYEFIPKFNTALQKYTKQNCLDYLQDNRCIDLIDKNKLVQNTFHWSLLDNPEYMFNLYDGCAPIFKPILRGDEEERFYDTKGLYGNTPDILTKDKNIARNLLSWTNILVFENVRTGRQMDDEFLYSINNLSYEDISNNDDYIVRPILRNNAWWYNGLRLKSNPLVDPSKEEYALCDNMIRFIYLPNCSIHDLLSTSNVFNEVGWILHEQYGLLFAYKPMSHIFLIFFTEYKKDNDENNGIERFILKKDVVASIADIDMTDTNMANILIRIIKGILSLYDNMEAPSVIGFHNSVQPRNVQLPRVLKYIKHAKSEIEYTKGYTRSYCIRYDGNIYPYFIKPSNEEYFNYTYAVKQYNTLVQNKNTSNNDVDLFNEYTKTGFEPKYPSLHYFYLKRYKAQSDKYYRNTNRYYREQFYFKKNLVYFLPQQLDITYIKTSKNGPLCEYDLKRLLKKWLMKNLDFEYYGDISIKWKKVFDYIWGLYDYTFTYDYLNNTNINKTKYIIKYNLK